MGLFWSQMKSAIWPLLITQHIILQKQCSLEGKGKICHMKVMDKDIYTAQEYLKRPSNFMSL